MDKQQKQIEELAKYLLDRFDLILAEADAISISNYILKRYQPKLPKDSVVLTKEEYEKVKHVLKYEPEEAIIRLEDLAKNERLYNPHMFCSLAGCSGVHKGCNRTCKESWIVIERKETAEKIMNEISGDILTVNTKEYGNIEVIPVERLQEICTNITEGN